MFKKIEIQLRGPICSCPEQNLSWGIWLDKDNCSGLRVRCKNCNVEVNIPNSQFTASFRLDVPYPGRPKQPVKWSVEAVDAKAEEKK